MKLGPQGSFVFLVITKTSPADWRQKRLDVQLMVATLGCPTLFLTITMNVWHEQLKKLGLSNEDTGAFSTKRDRYRPFDCPYCIARVYILYANSIMRDVQSNSEH